MKVGDVIDRRFEIEREVTEGGMGRIYRAFDRHDGRRVALKVVALGDGAGAERFRRESVLLAEIRHPGIVDYVAHGEASAGAPYLAMEWLDGVDLALHLEGSRIDDVATLRARATPSGRLAAEHGLPAASAGLPIDEVVVLARRVAAAAAALHHRGIVHRDIKPSNLFLVAGDVGQVKLVDFGTARETLPKNPLTAEGVLIGTPYYMAPEQARGSLNIGPQADVWAIGCVLYECLVGLPPFAAPQPLAALARIILDEPRPVESQRSDVPPLLAALVARCLHKEPARRFADGHELAIALNEVPIDEPRAQQRPGRRDEQLARRRAAVGTHCLTTSETRVCSLLFARGADHGVAPEHLQQVADEHGGLLEPLADGSGSLLITVPGVPTPKDQAARAARIALALRAAAPELMLVLATGRGRDSGHTPIGEVVDAAVAALMSARPGEIRVDHLTAGLLDARFALEGDGERRILIGERSAEGARTLLGKPSRWVGRRRELGTLVAVLEECADERVARAVLVTAPAGIGKSRLRYELLRTVVRDPEHLTGADLSQPVVLYGQGDSLSSGSPFVMIAPALRRFAGIRDGEPLARRRDKLTDMVRRTVADPDRERITTFLGELMGVPIGDESREPMRAARADPMLMGDLMRSAFVDWLRALCDHQPVLVVLEDLHWGDLPSVSYIDAALRDLADERLMVLALARPEVHDAFPGLWSQRAVEELRLHALTPRACAELVHAALGAAADGALVDKLAALSEGNAFYLEELIRAVAEGAADTLPETVIGMVQARLDGLDLEARRILRAASIFGEVFWEGGVRALLGASAGGFDVSEWLDDLARREVISRRPDARLPDEREFKFRHALVRDGAYEMLTDRDRQLGHQLAGTWLVDAGEQDALVLAEHFARGGDAAHAVSWFLRAAEQAFEGNDLQAVIERAERAVDAGATGSVLGELRALQSSAAYWQSDYADALRYGTLAAALLAEGSSAWFRAAGSALVSSARLGDYDTVDALFERLIEATAQPGAEPAQLIALCRGTFQLIFHGRFDRADDILDHIADLAHVAPEIDALTSAQVDHVQGVRAAHIGDVRTFLLHLEAAVASFERAGDTRNVSLERTTLAWCYAEIGEFERAENACRDNLLYCERIRAQQAMTYGKVNLGYILGHRPGKRDEARAVLREAIDECRRVHNPRLEGWALAHLSAVELRLGEHTTAEIHARRAAELLAVSPGLQSWALASHGRALLALGAIDEALATARAAMAILERLGGLLQGESLPPLVLTEALRAAGEPDAARAAAKASYQRLQSRAERLEDAHWRATFLAIDDNQRITELYRQLCGRA